MRSEEFLVLGPPFSGVLLASPDVQLVVGVRMPLPNYPKNSASSPVAFQLKRNSVRGLLQDHAEFVRNF